MYNNQKGFTLIEMLIVLTIISLLIILIIPNIGSKSKTVNDKGCEALEEVIQTQVSAYYLEKEAYPKTVDELEEAGYITEKQTECKDGTSFEINDGEVSANKDNVGQ